MLALYQIAKIERIIEIRKILISVYQTINLQKIINSYFILKKKKKKP